MFPKNDSPIYGRRFQTTADNPLVPTDAAAVGRQISIEASKAVAGLAIIAASLVYALVPPSRR